MYRKITFLLITFLTLGYHANAYKDTTDSLLIELKKPHADTMRVRILLAICEAGQISKDSSLLFIHNALQLAEKSKNPQAISRSYHYLCHWQIANLKNYDTILFYCRKHLEIMEQFRFVNGMALACCNLGGAFTWISLDSSMYYNLKSIELYTEAKKPDNANNVKINLSNVYFEMKRYADAISILKETAAYATRIGNRYAIELSYLNMAECYLKIGDLASAEISIKQAAPKDADPYANGYFNCQLANVYYAQARFDEATKLYTKALEIGKKNNLDYILYLAYLGMADVSFKNKMWQEAKHYKELSWNYSYKDHQRESDMYQMFYKCDSALGNYKASLLGYQKLIAARDSFQNNERLKSADAMEAKYKNKESRTKIELLNKENKIQQVKVEQQQFIRNAVVILCLIAFAFAGLLFNRFKLKKKIESQHAIIKERKRISNELHDDLGAQLSTARMFLTGIINNADPEKNKTLVENSIQLIDGSINDLRKIMDDLQVSTLLEKGYIIATEELVNKINQLQQINFTLRHYDVYSRLEQKTEHNLFRVTQELINNTLKYANAKNVAIDLLKRDDKIVFMYEDDGDGFDLGNTKPGYGLSNIESRIKSISGELNFDTSIGNGFRATIEIPYRYA